MPHPHTIDAVLARDEEELIFLREKIYKGLMDTLIIGESRFDFSGAEKNLNFTLLQQDGLLAPSTQVVEVVIPDEIRASGDKTLVQDSARLNFLSSLIKRFPRSTIFFSDVDEFPSFEQISTVRNRGEETFVESVPMFMFYRRANWELLREKRLWKGPKVLRGVPVHPRVRSMACNTLSAPPGAHLSYLYSEPSSLGEKLGNLAAGEFNNPALAEPDFISFCDRFGLDHLARAEGRGLGLLRYRKIHKLPVVCHRVVELHPQWRGERFGANHVVRLLASQVALLYREGNPLGKAVVNGGVKVLSTDVLRVCGPVLIRSMLRVLHLWGEKEAKKLRRRIIRLFGLIVRRLRSELRLEGR